MSASCTLLINPCDLSKNPLDAAVTKTGNEGISRDLFLSNPSFSIHLSAPRKVNRCSFLRFWLNVPRKTFWDALQSVKSNEVPWISNGWLPSEIRQKSRFCNVKSKEK